MAAEGAAALFGFMAMLSMNLAILNLLPIPMLDGGHIFIMRSRASRAATSACASRNAC